MRPIIALGLLIVVVSLSVLFSETLFVSFAAALGYTMVDVALGWLALGVAIIAGAGVKIYVTE